MIKQIIKKVSGYIGISISRLPKEDRFPVLRPLDRNGIEILADKKFQKSCLEIEGLTLLDTPRLANLWVLCRMTAEEGAIIEIGSYKGGGALHLSNSCPKREIIICDPFSPESFEKIDPILDKPFSYKQFSNTTEENIKNLFVRRNRKYLVICGYFPNSVLGKDISQVSFVHLDVDTYKATSECLDYLINSEFLMKKSLIVVDDYDRMADGVNKALSEIVSLRKDWFVVPMFPSQALLIPIHWFG